MEEALDELKRLVSERIELSLACLKRVDKKAFEQIHLKEASKSYSAFDGHNGALGISYELWYNDTPELSITINGEIIYIVCYYSDYPIETTYVELSNLFN